jgi:plasmid stabilization system protein ParE
MDHKVVLSDFFVPDLKEIVDYLVDQAGADTARRIGNELLDRALKIGRNPFMGHPVKQRPGIRKVLRYSYLIYYEVDETRRLVEVLRLWHGRRDPETLRLK